MAATNRLAPAPADGACRFGHPTKQDRKLHDHKLRGRELERGDRERDIKDNCAMRAIPAGRG
jgi:hypothetical protein